MKFIVHIVSKDTNFMMVPSDNSFRNANGHEFDVCLNESNKDPIGKAHNEFINQHSNDNFDYAILMHSDVSFDTTALADHIAAIHGKYDVIGLCGCSKLVVSQTPLNWFCGSRPCPETRWGCVSHGEIGNQTTYFSSHSPMVFDHEVACIDGLCIIMSKHAVDVGLRFDPSVGDFDLYDTDLSFQALISYKLKLGVIVQKDLHHFSLGKSILSDKFLANEFKFRRKWNLPIPQQCQIAYSKYCSSN